MDELGNNWLEWALGLAAGLLGWLLLQVWKSKPSRDEMTGAIQVAIAAFHAADKEADALLLVPVYLEIKHLREAGDAKHADNIEQFRELKKKLDRLIDYLMTPKGH